MFTGIVKNIGHIKAVSALPEGGLSLAVALPSSYLKTAIGGSIAIDGACLTLVSVKNELAHFEVIPETVSRTIMRNYQVDTRVNVEPSLRVGDDLAGHYVLGHVDTVITIKEITQNEKGYNYIFSLPTHYQQNIAIKGSVTINGVALTVSNVTPTTFQVSLISHTLHETTFQYLKVGDDCNLEIDPIARYVERLYAQSR